MSACMLSRLTRPPDASGAIQMERRLGCGFARLSKADSQAIILGDETKSNPTSQDGGSR
jgi:hypothetical protein